jgi:hypothetical protein
MRVTSGSPARFDGGDVHVVGGREHHGILGDLIVVKCESLARRQPGIERKRRDRAMVPVTIDGPLSEDHIGPFPVQKACEGLIVWGIDDRAAVDLSHESGNRFETLTSLLGFGGAYGGTTVESLSPAVSLSAVQVEQNHLMAKLRVSRDCTGAAAFGIARMTAHDDNLEGFGRGLRQ